MPRLLIVDAHEWINEIFTVPDCALANSQTGERACNGQRGKKTLLSLTLACRVQALSRCSYRWEAFVNNEIPLRGLVPELTWW